MIFFECRRYFSDVDEIFPTLMPLKSSGKSFLDSDLGIEGSLPGIKKKIRGKRGVKAVTIPQEAAAPIRIEDIEIKKGIKHDHQKTDGLSHLAYFREAADLALPYLSIGKQPGCGLVLYFFF